MELLQLKYFEMVARYENVSRAAEELHISQPSLSNSLLRLERELGYPLFTRRKRRLELNSNGRYFLSLTRKMLSLANAAKLPGAGALPPARISIAFQNYNERIFSLVERFHRENPHVEFDVYGSTLEEPFAGETYDFLVGSSSARLPVSLHSLTVEDRGYFAVLPRSHPLAEREALDLRELREESFCFLRDSGGNFEHAYQFCIETGFLPKCVFSTNHPYFKLRFLQRGECVGVIPTGWREAYAETGTLSVLPLEGLEKFSEIQLLWSDETLESYPAASFLEFVRGELTSP